MAGREDSHVRRLSSVRPCCFNVVAEEVVAEDGEKIEIEVEQDVEDAVRVKADGEDSNLRKLQDPKMPTKEEVDKHFILGHIPYRSWCPVCVRAQGKDMDHARDKGKVRNLPEYSWDYCFPGDELGFKWTVLVGRERSSKSVMATALATKGLGTGKFAVDKCLDFIEENGDGNKDVIVKTDQESSAKYLIKDIVSERSEGKTMIEESPVRSSGSNGIVERAVQEIEGRIRSLFLGLQDRLGRKIDTTQTHI